MRISSIIAGLMLAGFFAHSAFAASTDIKMLPPLGYDNTTVCGQGGAGAGVLYWDGVNPIYCIPGFGGSSNGDVAVNTGVFSAPNGISTNGLTLGGVGPLGTTHATAMEQLVTANCGNNGTGYSVLTRANGVISCTAVTDLLQPGTNKPIGQTFLTSCPTGTVLTSIDGLTFSCVSDAPTVPSCPAGEVLIGVTNGNPICTAFSFSCPAGQILTGVSNGSPVCGAMPTTNCNGAAYAATTATDGGGNTICPAICPAGTGPEYAMLPGGGYGWTGGVLNFPNGKVGDPSIPPSGNYFFATSNNPAYGNSGQWGVTPYISPGNYNGAFADSCPANYLFTIACTANGWAVSSFANMGGGNCGGSDSGGADAGSSGDSGC